MNESIQSAKVVAADLNFANEKCGYEGRELEAMDEAYRKHHMWALPKLKKLPSDYFREHGAASFQDDPIGLELAPAPVLG